MRRDVKLLYDVMADTIGYIQVKMSAASLQLARIHARFMHYARFVRDEIINSLRSGLAPRIARNKLHFFSFIFIVQFLFASRNLDPIHTYHDIFESATFSFRIRLPSTRNDLTGRCSVGCPVYPAFEFATF